MIQRISSALVRAWLTVMLIVTPALVLPGREDGGELVLLLAMVIGLLVFVEYLADYPGLVEFSSAPPFNRIRFGMLFVTVLAMAAICRGIVAPNVLTDLVTAIGVLVGLAIDVPYSPVQLMTAAVAAHEPATVDLVRAMTGVAYLAALVSLAGFLAAARFAGWPGETGFNVWTNLPTFEPTASPDVVARLRRDARLNIVLGLTLPFVIPSLVTAGAPLLPPLGLASPQTLIWIVAAWAFLPASLVMRGIAMGLVAEMIDAQRHSTALQPA